MREAWVISLHGLAQTTFNKADQADIDPSATMHRPSGKKSRFTRDDLHAILERVAPNHDGTRQLTFENAAVAAGVAEGPARYRASWFLFDNATGDSRPLSETSSTTTTLTGPSDLPDASGSFVRVDISVDSEMHPAWRHPVQTYFRREAEGWKLVGLQRMPESATSDRAVQTATR